MNGKWTAAGLVVVLAAGICGTPMGAPAATVTVEGEDIRLFLDGQVRVRGQDHHDAGPDDGVDNAFSYVSQRARLGVKAKIGDAGSVYVQVQDVRLWGEETDTNKDYSADTFDLHQGYGELGFPGAVIVRAGRQEILIENQRLVGPVGWSDQGRSFDAVRVLHEGSHVSGGGFYALLQEPDSTLASAYRYDFYGGHVKWHALKAVSVSGVYFFQDDRNASLFRHTFGSIVNVAVSGLKAHGEFYWQAGKTGGVGIEAFMASVGLGWNQKFGSFDLFQIGRIGDVTVGLYGAGDVLSGDQALGSGNYRTFNTLFATNHKFYGFMDNFTSFPAHTGGLGLIDIIGRAYVSHVLLGRKVKYAADYHKFRVAVDTAAGNDDLGHEIDGAVTVVMSRGIKVQAGYSAFWPETVTRNTTGRTVREDWSYLMSSWTF